MVAPAIVTWPGHGGSTHLPGEFGFGSQNFSFFLSSFFDGPGSSQHNTGSSAADPGLSLPAVSGSYSLV